MGGSRPPRLCPTVLCPDRWWWGWEGDGEGKTGACDLVGVEGMAPAGANPLSVERPLFSRPDLLSQLEGRDAALPEYL